MQRVRGTSENFETMDALRHLRPSQQMAGTLSHLVYTDYTFAMLILAK